jgi:membrane fusion protein (multidrug efflux system)
MRSTICAVFLIFTSGLAAYAQGGGPAPAPVPVGTVKAERKPITRGLEFVGRVEAINRVEIRARVKGFLEDVLFKEGAMVTEGDALYRIEKGLFEADVEQAQGALERSKAAYDLANTNFERQQELLNRNAGTVAARDQARAAVGSAQGQMITDQANLKTAQINLGYTEIASPITGEIGRTNITKGNVVGPDSGVLTVVASQDPMYVTFPVSQRDFLLAQQTGRRLNADLKDFKVRLRYSDGSSYDQVGEVNFVDVQVDRATDTVLMRATIANPKGGLTDGQLVRVRVEVGEPEERVVVPQEALLADQEGVYVFIVEGDKAAVRRVKPGGESGTDTVVQEGLSGGEQIIVEGLQSVRPGAVVRATPIAATIKPTLPSN